MNDTQRRVEAVLARIAASCAADEDAASMYSEALESVLDMLADEDAFGTERQNDPRGDGRNGEWSMNYVEGVDESETEA